MVIDKAQRETRFTCAGGEDRLDSGGGRHPLPVRCDARVARRAGARTGGQEAHAADQGQTTRVARSFAVGRRDGPRDLKDTRAAHRSSQGAGDGAQRAGRAADRPLGQRGQRLAVQPGPRRAAAVRRPSCGPPPGSSSSLRAARRSPSRSTVAQRVEDHRPAGVARGPRCPADPQGQARQTYGVWVRRPDLRGDGEHPQGRPRAHPARRPRARATPPRTGYCPRPRSSSNMPGSDPRRSSATAASSPAPPKTRSPISTEQQIQISGRHEPGSRAGPASAEPATEPVSRAASATSNAATGCADPG